MQYTQRRETSNRRPPKKVLNILDSICSKSEDLTTTLFIGDLSVICDEIKLYELFSGFGGIDSVQLKKSDRDPQRAHLGFGFIKFGSRDSAERALQELNGYFFLGRAMRVGWAVDYGKQQSPTSMEKSTDLKKGQTAQIHVMFVTRELNRRVSELDLGGVFSRYGNLVDIAIKKNAISSEYGVQSGYAFLHFASTREGLKSAITAVEQANNLVFDNIAYRCKVTHNLQAQLLSMNYSEEEPVGGAPSLPHVNTATLPDPLFQNVSPTHRMNPVEPFEMDSRPQQFISVSSYSGKDFRFSMDPSRMMGRTEPSLSPLPPTLDHNLTHFDVETNSYSPLSKKNSYGYIMNSFTRQQSTMVSPNFIFNNNNSDSSPTSQQHMNPPYDHYHHQLAVDPLSFPLGNTKTKAKTNNNYAENCNYKSNNNSSYDVSHF